MGGLLKTLRVLWYFYFATHVQFLVCSLTKQVADMERVSHKILSHAKLYILLYSTSVDAKSCIIEKDTNFKHYA